MFGTAPILPFIIPAIALYLMLGILIAQVFEWLYLLIRETRPESRSKEVLIFIFWPIILVWGILIIILGLLTAIFSICAFVFGSLFCLLITRFLNLLESFYKKRIEQKPADSGLDSAESDSGSIQPFMDILRTPRHPFGYEPPVPGTICKHRER